MATMRCFRGEKSQWWPEPAMRLVAGMTVFEPWPGDIPELWQLLQMDIVRHGQGSVNSYAQYLRASGHPYALATARTAAGAFEFEYNYVIEIPNARVFRWLGDRRLLPGAAADGFIDDPATVDAHYIVLDADTVDRSGVLGFGHNTGTREVTFFHGLPLTYVVSCNGKAIDPASIVPRAAVPFEQRMKWQKIHRPIQPLRRPRPAFIPAPQALPAAEAAGMTAHELMAEAARRFRRSVYDE